MDPIAQRCASRLSFEALAAALSLLSAFPLAAVAASLHADRASFDAAAGPLSLETFESFAPGLAVCSPVHPWVPEPCRLALPAMTLVSTRGMDDDADQRPNLFIEKGLFGGPSYSVSAGVIPGPDDFYLEFRGTAFGFDASFYWTHPIGMTASDRSGQVLSFDSTAAPGGSFFGVTGLVRGTWRVSVFSVTTPDGISSNFDLDNIAVTAVPEPMSTALMLAGLGCLGAVLWSRRKPGAACTPDLQSETSTSD